MESVTLSLVVPLHNEEANVDSLVAACRPVLERLAPSHELILVDDGSTDGTLRAIREAAGRHDAVHGIALRRRFGKGSALAAGIRRARGDRIATIDGDLQEDPEELDRLLARLDSGYDLVTGWRRRRRDPWLKRTSSKLFNAVVRVLTRVAVRDLNCGFKVMRREVADELVLTGGRFRFMPLLAHGWGYRVSEVEITHRQRARGRSSYGLERFPGVLIDLFAVACLIRYHARPGHLFIQSGALSFLGGVGVCSYIAWLRLSTGTIQSRYPLLALGVLLIVIGVQLSATGFLGEWLAYRNRDAEPGFRVGWSSDDPPTREQADPEDPEARP